VAGFLATALIVVLGEIVPQAVFARYAMKLVHRFVWIAKLFIFLLYPITLPMARTLDKFLGQQMPTVYTKKELIKIIEEHEDSKQSDIDEDEERIIKGALSFSDKKVGDIMTPRTEVFDLQADEKCTKAGDRADNRLRTFPDPRLRREP
jgi:metal transporter CNNM